MSNLTMGLAQLMSDVNKQTRPEPSQSVKLYTLIKDYAERKYNADENTVMKLYIGTKHYPKISDNAALIEYVDGKMNPEKPKPKQPEQKPDEITTVKKMFGDNVDVTRHKDKIKITVADSQQEETIVNTMKTNGYRYSTKKGLSYFFVK